VFDGLYDDSGARPRTEDGPPIWDVRPDGRAFASMAQTVITVPMTLNVMNPQRQGHRCPSRTALPAPPFATVQSRLRSSYSNVREAQGTGLLSCPRSGRSRYPTRTHGSTRPLPRSPPGVSSEIDQDGVDRRILLRRRRDQSKHVPCSSP